MNINPKDFQDIQTMQLAIQDFIMSSGSFDESEYDCDAAALYLAWYGLTKEQIKMFQKDDVWDDGIIIRGKKELLPYNILCVFRRLRDADGYYTASGGMVFHAYEKSDYLIRRVAK